MIYLVVVIPSYKIFIAHTFLCPLFYMLIGADSPGKGGELRSVRHS
jgi:hypothetical protein